MIRERNYKVLVGEDYYRDTERGVSMAVDEGFEVLVDENTRKSPRWHILGPNTPKIIQEASMVMNFEEGTYFPIVRSMHIRPSMSEVL